MIKLKDSVAAVRDVFKGGVTPAAETNTHVTLASQEEPPNRKEGEYDGEMPKSNALVSDRSRVLAEISERRNAQVVADAEEGNKTFNGEDTVTTDPEIQGEDLDAGDDTVPGEPAVETPAAPVAEEMRTLIVDGKPIQVPVSKIIERGTATFQKEAAADARLAEANRLLEQAQRISAQPPKEVVQDDVSGIAKLTSAERVHIIRYGTDEEAAQVQKYIEDQARPQFKPEDIERHVRQSVGPQIAFEAGKSFAATEYGDLLTDPDLGAIFLNRENAARAQGDQRSYAELYKAIGDDMRVKFNRPKQGAPGAAQPTPKPAASTSRTMEEKQQAKANAPSLPRLASARLEGDANAPRPPTRPEMFAAMRRSRGFTQGKDL